MRSFLVGWRSRRRITTPDYSLILRQALERWRLLVIHSNDSDRRGKPESHQEFDAYLQVLDPLLEHLMSSRKLLEGIRPLDESLKDVHKHAASLIGCASRNGNNTIYAMMQAANGKHRSAERHLVRANQHAERGEVARMELAASLRYLRSTHSDLFQALALSDEVIGLIFD